MERKKAPRLGHVALIVVSALFILVFHQASPTFAATSNRITSISPTCANPGDQVTITGYGFGAKNAIVTVGGIQANIVYATGSKVIFIVPASAPYGPTTVELRHKNGSQQGSIAFQVGCNRIPVADAGQDQDVMVGHPVILDGRNSVDPDGDLITYRWTIVQAPQGSATALDNPSSVTPTFVPDKPGDYRIELIVNDGKANSEADDVMVFASHPNVAPTAYAGQDQSVVTGSLVSLDGTGSYDPDGDALTYRWEMLARPVGSQATLSNPLFSTSSFTVDYDGQYIIQLTVDDGQIESLPDDVVVISATPNAAPIALAGNDQTVSRNTIIQLDGSGSSDPNNDPLTFRWSIVSSPQGSTSQFDDATSPTPTILADSEGEFVFRLVVNDGQLESVPDTVVVVAVVVNDAPMANAGPDRDVAVETPVSLDGSGSSDPDGDPLSYQWSLLSAPAGSTSTISSPTSVTPSITPDVAGAYTIQLVVSDGLATSAPDTMTITAVVPSAMVPDVVGLSQAAAEAAITGAKLIVGIITTSNSETVPAGAVISQHPLAGTSVLQGSAVDLVISLGPEGPPVPPDPSTVAPPLSQTSTTDLGSATAFLYSGSNPIQTGVAPGTIEPMRAAVIRGKVLDHNGAPLPAVRISVLNHPEFGQTLTRADGMFDLAVNGGGLLTVKYEKAGYLPAQRQVQVPWRDYAWLPDVMLIPRDTQATIVDLMAPTPMQAAQGSPVTDSDGTRRATLLIPQGTQAQVLLPDGSTQAVSTLTLRLTEYTVGPNGPQRMPAALPPNSAYTYAVELGADEAIAKIGGKDVLLSQPVFFYVENFLNFPVGELVPMGYYDNSRGTWVPSDNGRIIKILGITGGLADLDTDGDGVADTGLGITEAERQQLAALYPAGQSLSRVPITHLSTWDKNWGIGCGDCEAPNEGKSPPIPNDPCLRFGSIVECENQVLGEGMDVVGTSFTLNYRSSRTMGYKPAYRLEISLSENGLPAGVVRIDLDVTVAGRRFVRSFPALPNQRTTFVWDGQDAYGRMLQGAQPITVRIGYLYDAVYQRVERFGYNGNGTMITGDRQALKMTLWQVWQGVIGAWDARGQGLGGWSLSVHHAYDPIDKVLYLGDGSRRSASGVLVNTIATVAGTGAPDSSGDDGPATEAGLARPFAVAVGPDGSFYIADRDNGRYRRVGPDGIITTIFANTKPDVFTIPNGLGVDVGPDLSLYIADTDGSYQYWPTGGGFIWRVWPGSAIDTIVAGGFQLPYGVALGPDGSLYIAERGSHRIRRVETDGTITTVAGTGAPGFSGDGGPAIQARLQSPADVAATSDGSLYIADFNNYRIRRVGPDGIITTVAGNGLSGFSGDGGPATGAKLSSPEGVAVGADGGLYIAAPGSNRIRRVGPDGIITTVAGNGLSGFSGDGGPATQAKLNGPAGVAVGPDGSLYIADTSNHRIRRVSPPLPGFEFGDIPIAAEDGNEVYVFSSAGRHLRTLDALTQATRYQFSYDSAGRLTSVTDVNGNTTTVERDAGGNPTAIVGPFGHRTTLSADANGLLSSITNPAGESVQLAYTADGLLTSFTDPRGNVSRYSYDEGGRLIRADDPAGGFKTLTRTATAAGYTVALTTALGRTTTYAVERLSTGDVKRTVTDPSGARTQMIVKTDGTRQVTQPDGTLTTFVEGPDPRWGMLAPLPKSQVITTPGGLTSTSAFTRKVTLSDPNNPFSLISQTDTLVVNGTSGITTQYEAATRTLTTTSAAGRQRTVILDANGRVVQEQVSGLEPTTYVYDVRGRLSTVAEGSGAGARTVSLAYGPDGFLASVTDPLGRTATFINDAAGRPTGQMMPGGRTVSYTYNPSGHVATLTPLDGTVHAFTHTAVGLVASYEPPDVGAGSTSTSYTYDVDRALMRELRPDGQAVDLAYDSFGRLSALTTARGALSYAYDAANHLADITAPGAMRLTYTYDGFFLTDETANGVVVGSVTRAYDTALRLRSRSLNGSAVAFTYDSDDLLIQAGALSLTRSPQHGLVKGTTLGAVTTSQTYNGFGEMTGYSAAASGSPFYDVQYTRDLLGRIIRQVETIDGVMDTREYSYDAAGRLVDVRTNHVLVESYTYDANGNRLSATVNGTSVSGVYDDQDRLTQYGNLTYTYTANGELATKTAAGRTTTYQYDALGQVLSATLPSGTQIEYLIDGQNRRVGKKVNGALVQGFLYADDLRPIAEIDAANNVVSRFVYAGKYVPAYMLKGGATYRLVTDHLGSVRLVVDSATGAVQQRIDYDAFGNVVQDTNPGFQPFGFAGGLYDVDTQLVRFGARDYDAETGRWTAKDPLGFGGRDANLYAYTSADPVNFLDPAGLDDIEEPSTEEKIAEDVTKKVAHDAAKRLAKSPRNPTANKELELLRKKTFEIGNERVDPFGGTQREMFKQANDALCEGDSGAGGGGGASGPPSGKPELGTRSKKLRQYDEGGDSGPPSGKPEPSLLCRWFGMFCPENAQPPKPKQWQPDPY